MRGELVSIDLETTGLDPTQDTIIEIGAVRLRDGVIVDEYSTLVNPGRSIPAPVVHITGIRNDDVVDAPVLAAVLPRLRAFAGDSPWVAHNIAFDASFLNRQGLLQNNLRIDTYELASVLLPRAPRYNLTSLARLVGFQNEEAHRALSDARAAALLYWALWQKTLALPLATLREIVEAARDLPWDGKPVFEAALRERISEGAPDQELSLIEIFGRPPANQKPLQRREDTQALSVEAAQSVLDAQGLLAQSFPGYEHRPQQLQMVGAIVESFNASQHLMIEAGTGTGKSLAYLVPAALWALRNGERVVISTNTINLQEQLIAKDIPALETALGQEISAALMKGRANYLCLRRLATARRRRPTSIDELRMLAKILVWLLESPTGDRGEITLRGPDEMAVWNRLSAEDEQCSLDRCVGAMEGACPFYKARKAADAAPLLIVNHALLVSDAMAEQRVLPDYRYLIIDEAHHIEDAVTGGLSFRLDEWTLRRRLADLGGTRRGLLGSLLLSVEGHVSDKEMRRLQTFVQGISEAANAMEVHITRLFGALRTLGNELSPSRGDFSPQVRITPQVRGNTAFQPAQTAWETLAQFFEGISEALHYLATALTRLKDQHLPDYSDLVSGIDTASRYLNEVRTQLNAFLREPDANTIYWLGLGHEADYLSINSAPLNVGTLLEKLLWHNKESVILTSATLQTNRSFNFIRSRLNASDIEAVEVGSPFNYQQAVLLYVPDDMPDPTDRGRYQTAVERGLIDLADKLKGRVMALFTSYTQLRQTAQAITPRLALGNITVYDQSDGSSRQALLDGFKSNERAVLLGTKSFWEGVDIPGESLSALVIVRLPFAVPTDPVFAARSETYGDAFNEYTLPDAILRFRQGFGRLIRTSTDRGVIAVFDSRIISKSYGSLFISSLPNCTLQHGPLNQLPQLALNWLNRAGN